MFGHIKLIAYWDTMSMAKSKSVKLSIFPGLTAILQGQEMEPTPALSVVRLAR